MTTATQNKPSTPTKNFKDVYQMVTDTIVQQLEAGVIPWQQPWTGGEQRSLKLPYNFNTGNHYRGINIVMLWCSAIKHNYVSDQWGSFKQWNEKNEAVRKGEKGNLIVYYDTIEKELDGEIEKIPFLKSSYVFNRCQLASYTNEMPAQQAPTTSLVEKVEAIDAFLANTQAIIENHEGGACYNRVSDKILMPYLEKFYDTQTCTATEGYYSSTLHELVHWSGAPHRLNRTKGTRFGDQAYAVEELVAEFGAAFLCAGFGIATVEKGDHAGYIDNWLGALKENNRCLFTAASKASTAVNYLNMLTISKCL